MKKFFSRFNCESFICGAALIGFSILAIYGLLNYMYALGVYFGVYPLYNIY